MSRSQILRSHRGTNSGVTSSSAGIGGILQCKTNQLLELLEQLLVQRGRRWTSRRLV
jgi:hypothetical protein